VLVAIIRKRLNLALSLHSMLQILSVRPFDKEPLIQLLDAIFDERPIREAFESALMQPGIGVLTIHQRNACVRAI